MELPYKVPKWLWWLVSSLCLLLTFLHHGLWPLMPIGLALWVYAISQSDNLKEVAIGSFIVGLGKYAGGIFWFWETYPVAGAAMIAPWQQWLMIGYFWLTIAGSMALGLCLIGLATVYLLRSNKYLILWPVLFVMGEIVSSFFFSIFTAGPGSYLNANFSFGYAGLSLANLAVLFPVISITGLYGLSLVAAIFGLILFLIFRTEKTARRPLYKISLGLVSLLVIANLLLPPPPVKTLGIKLIAVESRYNKHSYDDPDGLYLKRQGMIAAAEVALQFPSDIVLMPEDSRLTEKTAAIADTLVALQSLSPKTKLIVDTFRSEDLPDQAVLRAVYYDLENATTTFFDKQYMVPIGEFVMNFEAWSLRLFGQPETLDHLTRNQNYVPGPKNKYAALTADLPGLLFCFESAAPLAVRRLKANQDMNLVLHPISHGWFHNPRIFWQNADAMLQIQAIWNNTTIVSAGNMSPSKVYRPDGAISTGEVIHETPYWRLVEYNL